MVSGINQAVSDPAKLGIRTCLDDPLHHDRHFHYHVLSASGKQQVLLTTIILIVHLVANFSWTPLFFGAQNPLLALLDIIVLDVTLVVLIVLFWKASTIAAVLLIPYLCWVSFATYLNAGFYWLNRG